MTKYKYLNKSEEIVLSGSGKYNLLRFLSYILVIVAILLPFIPIAKVKFWNLDYQLFLMFMLIVPSMLFHFPRSEYIRPVVMLLSLAMFGFLQFSCPRVPRSLELMISALVHHRPVAMYTIKIGVFVITAFLFSRFYCVWICPKGIIQEYIYRPGLKIEVHKRLDSVLKKVKFVLLIALIVAALWGDFKLFKHIGPFHTLFNMSGTAIMVIWLALWLIFSIFIDRPYCRYFCPEGALLGLINRLSLLKVRVVNNNNGDSRCNNCKRCEKVCPVDAIHATNNCNVVIDEYECIACRSCEMSCPQGCLSFKYGTFNPPESMSR